MNTTRTISRWSTMLLVSLLTATAVFGQMRHPHHHHHPPIIIVPPARPIVRQQVQITGVKSDVKIVNQVATTTIRINLKNPGNQRLEATMVFPVPDKVSVRGFDFGGSGKEPTAKLMPRADARKIYNDIVRQMKDPAILEFAGLNLIKSCVFPVEPHNTQWVSLTYEQVLKADGNRVDYVLPRSESLSYTTPWSMTMSINSNSPISTVYSPSHEIATKRISKNELSLTLSETAAREPGPIRISYLQDGENVSASLLAYPSPKVGGGYFLLLTGLPAGLDAKKVQETVKREVIVVIDRSGSMSGEKIRQAKKAALQVVSGLDDGESFNLISYNESVQLFKAQPVVKNDATLREAEAFLNGVTPRGGTNIHDALVEAMRQKPINDKNLPIVLFLTDGLPTIGVTDEKDIREAAVKGNTYKRRIFTFGVGVDVNTPLLDKIAGNSRAKATYILPKESVEVKVGSVFKRLYGPVLDTPEITVCDKNGKPAPGLVQDLIPYKLPDMFIGDQLVLLGKYVKEEPITFKLKGNYLGKSEEFTFDFKLDGASTTNSFVPRLWASRKIAFLVDAIRDMGANPGAAVRPGDVKLKELVDEVVKLSLEFGILTEYTAYLAREGTDLAQPSAALRREATEELMDRAMGVRSGEGSVNQSFNGKKMATQKSLNRRNVYVDEKMKKVEVTSVQQVNDLAFYNRKGVWVDSRIAKAQRSQQKADRTVEFGTKDFDDLLDQLVKENRQGSIAMGGDVMIDVKGKNVLVRMSNIK